MELKDFIKIQDRRNFLQECAGGFGMVALYHLLAQDGLMAAPGGELPEVNPLAPKAPHFAPKAKNVIFLYMAGAPSHIDLFDPKPQMKRWEGQSLPDSLRKQFGNLAFIRPTAKVWASPRKFKRYGQSGMDLCDLLPHLGKQADDICLIRSMQTNTVNHHPGQLMMNCGSPLPGRPSMGAWVTYGLGSDSQNLPGYVVLSTGSGTSAGTQNWSSGFLPSVHQGVPFRRTGDPVLYLSNPPGVTTEAQRARLDAIRYLNEQQFQKTGDYEIASRIASYELAFRMQAAAPGLLDFSDESAKTLEMYGVNKEPTKPFATNCLLARRMIERGVRFVQLFHASWDAHQDLDKNLKKNCGITDKPAAALIRDLKERGLLDSTLVIWGGEFGRTPVVEDRKAGAGKESWGRDHHRHAFTMWMAGGGIKGGQVIGKTDDFAFNVIEDPVHVHDLHATILHCLGFDHKELTFRHQGRDFRLTDVAGNVVPKLLA